MPCHALQEPLTDSEIEITKQPVDEAVKHSSAVSTRVNPVDVCKTM